MISIRRAADELERMESQVRTIASIYDHAVWSTAQYAVEIDPQSVHAFREHLKTLRDQVARASSAEDWQEIQSTFRGELRDYRDKATREMARLRKEIAGSAAAMQLLADSVASSGSDHEIELQKALGELSRVAVAESVMEAWSIASSATAAIEDSVKRIRSAYKLAIAQLRDEIRLLQDQVETERQQALREHSTGLWSRQKMNSIISRLTDRDEPFCLLVVCVRNRRQLESYYDRTIVEQATRAFAQRLAAMVDETAFVGRWDESCLAVTLEVEPVAALRISRQAADSLAGQYSVQERGVAVSVTFAVSAGVVDYRTGMGGTEFNATVEAMAAALASA